MAYSTASNVHSLVYCKPDASQQRTNHNRAQFAALHDELDYCGRVGTVRGPRQVESRVLLPLAVFSLALHFGSRSLFYYDHLMFNGPTVWKRCLPDKLIPAAETWSIMRKLHCFSVAFERKSLLLRVCSKLLNGCTCFSVLFKYLTRTLYKLYILIWRGQTYTVDLHFV